MRTKEGQEALRRVLEAVAFCLPNVSYCQGMNFIGSVLIEEMGEEGAFYVFMHLMFNKELMSLFLAVNLFLKTIFIGISRATSEEFSNGPVDQVPFASAVPTPKENPDVSRLFHFQVVHDLIFVLPTL